MGAKNWKFVGQYQESDVKRIQNRLQLPHAVAVFLAARGMTPDDAPAFLSPSLENLSDPYRFPGIYHAAERLWEAVFRQEPILIHGDYDTDGITASALLGLTLRSNGATVHSFIPHRFDDGYGFTPESLEKALAAFPGGDPRREELERLLGLGLFIRNMIRTTSGIKRWRAANLQLQCCSDREAMERKLDEISGLLEAERRNVLETLPLAEADSRLGWEPRMDYVCDVPHLKWKLRQLAIAEEEINAYRKMIRL